MVLIRQGDKETLDCVYSQIAEYLARRFGGDPHYQKGDTSYFYYHKRLAKAWLASAQKMLKKGPILVNKVGGTLFYDSVEVLASQELDTLVWPDHLEEKITIRRWPGGKHYYLFSNLNRKFPRNPFGVYEKAFETAKAFTDNVVSKDC